MEEESLEKCLASLALIYIENAELENLRALRDLIDGLIKLKEKNREFANEQTKRKTNG